MKHLSLRSIEFYQQFSPLLAISHCILAFVFISYQYSSQKANLISTFHIVLEKTIARCQCLAATRMAFSSAALLLPPERPSLPLQRYRQIGKLTSADSENRGSNSRAEICPSRDSTSLIHSVTIQPAPGVRLNKCFPQMTVIYKQISRERLR